MNFSKGTWFYVACAMLPNTLQVKSYAKNFFMSKIRAQSFARIGKFGIFGHTCSPLGHLVRRADSEIFSRTSVQIENRPVKGFQVRPDGLKAKAVAAFTLIEAIISLGVLVFFVAACMSAIVINQVSVRKAKEQAIAMDFLTKYVETVKALPFTSVVAGTPINSLWNGANSAPLIAIPANASWVSVNTAAYQTFYPDLVWFQNRNPQMQVILTPNVVGGVTHDIEINVKISWDPPVSRGGRQQVQVDFFRTKDVSSL